MSSKKRLVLIDGNAILHRAYFALPPLTTRGGQLVNAVYGFTTMLLKVIADLRPTHLAVAFDTEKPTFRHAEYVGYQAQRPRMEADLSSQIEIVQDLIRTFGIPIYVLEGYEADDVIGTIAKRAVKRLPRRQAGKTQDERRKKESRIDEVIIVSGDRDLLQLVGKKIKVYAPIKGLSEARLFDEKGVKEYMGVKPSQIVDYKGLVGDASDNYPGVPGVGPKTAVELLAKFGSLEELYKKLATVAPAIVERLKVGYESAMLSQKLARIVTDAPVEFDLKEMRFRGVEGRKEAIERLGELGFKSLVARLQSPSPQRSPQRTQKKDGEKQLKLV